MEQSISHVFHPIKLASINSKPGRIIASVEDAARTLLTKWPGDEGERFYEAVKACLDCLHQLAEPAFVRLAFVRAAQDAGIIIEH